MKKNLFMVALAAALVSACTEPVGPKRDWEDTTIELSETSVEIGQAGSVATVEVTTPEDFVSASVDYAYSTWLKATVTDKVVTLKAVKNNPTIASRSGKVLVTAGVKGKTAQAYLEVVQEGADPSTIPTLTVDREEVTIGSDKDAVETVAITTNQPEVTALVASAAQGWLSATVEGTTLTLKTLEKNPEKTTRTGYVTLSASTVSVDITVYQSASVDRVSRVGTAYGTEGVIFWENPDNEKEVKIISTFAEKMVWSDPVGVTGATASEESGAANNEIVKQWSEYEGGTSVVKYCASQGEGWYQPSTNELQALFNAYNGVPLGTAPTNALPNAIPAPEKAARDAFEAVMEGIGGVKINTQADSANGDSIWACRENADGTKAYWYRFGKYGLDAGAKNSTARFGRCVKVVTLP